MCMATTAVQFGCRSIDGRPYVYINFLSLRAIIAANDNLARLSDEMIAGSPQDAFVLPLRIKEFLWSHLK